MLYSRICTIIQIRERRDDMTTLRDKEVERLRTILCNENLFLDDDKIKDDPDDGLVRDLLANNEPSTALDALDLYYGNKRQPEEQETWKALCVRAHRRKVEYHVDWMDSNRQLEEYEENIEKTKNQKRAIDRLASEIYKGNDVIKEQAQLNQELRVKHKKDILGVIAMTVASTLITIGLVALIVANDHVLRNTPLPHVYTVTGI